MGIDSMQGSREALKISAEAYLDQAIQEGEVDHSRVFWVRELGRFAGYTAAETPSGVKIEKTSYGSLNLDAEYEEIDSKGATHDLTVHVELPADGKAEVTEDRQRVEDGERTGEGGTRTVAKKKQNRILNELTKLIWVNY